MQIFMQFITLCIYVGDLVLLGIQWIYQVPGILFETGRKALVSLRARSLGAAIPLARHPGLRSGIHEFKHWILKRVQNDAKPGSPVTQSSTGQARNDKMKPDLPAGRQGMTLLTFSAKTRVILSRLGYFTLGGFAVFLIISAIQMHAFVDSLPNPSLIGVVNFSVATEIVDRNGTLLYEIYKDQKRTPVDLHDIPEHVREATIAIEDKGFYSHSGVSPIGGILRAVKDNWLKGSNQGGSTITQQLVKTALLTPEKTFSRKIKEAILALWVEQTYSKEKILGMYFNQVPYGGAAYGIEEAAQTYFGKSIKDVTIAEGAFLAGLPKAPSIYSPYANPQRARRRRDEVLQQMLEQGYIDDGQYAAAVATALEVRSEKNYIRAPHFVFYIKELLEEKFGVRRVEQGGLRVETSLDLRLQEYIERMLAEEVESLSNLHVSNGAALVTVPSTGEVLAMVGSKNYFGDATGAFNVTLAERQPGSSIKPIVYSLGLQERKITPLSIIDDAPITYSVPGGKPYSPVNYDGSYHGKVTVRTALANSYNIPAVKLANLLGVGNIIQHGHAMGLSNWEDTGRYGLSIALGGAEVRMVDMAVAYGVFANGGEKVSLDPLIRVTDYRGRVLYSATPEKKQILSKGVAFLMNSILSDVKARQRAFGSAPALQISGHSVAVKTGTTNEKRDNFTIGYTSSILAAAWVGNNDNTPMDPRLTSGITGAAPIWNNIMNYLLNTSSYGRYRYSDSFEPNEEVVATQCGGSKDYILLGTEKLFGQCNTRPRPTEVISKPISPVGQVGR